MKEDGVTDSEPELGTERSWDCLASSGVERSGLGRDVGVHTELFRRKGPRVPSLGIPMSRANSAGTDKQATNKFYHTWQDKSTPNLPGASHSYRLK